MVTQQILMTEAMLCEVLDISRSTARRLRIEGRLVPVHIGRSIRYRPADVDRFVAELETDADIASAGG